MSNNQTHLRKNTEDVTEISWRQVGKKLFQVFYSMGFSFVLLGLIIAASIAGSIIPQGNTPAAYMEQYGVQLGRWIYDFGLGDVFNCKWFVALALLLCLNLVLCSISRFPALLRAHKAYKSKYGKCNFGMFGSWVTHLGMLMLILSFGASRYLSTEYTIYGIPGSTQRIGNTGMELTIDSFDVLMRDDFTVEQYIAGLTLRNEAGQVLSGESSVNHPMEAFGYSVYQDSMGWAAYVDIYQGDTLKKTDLICAGEYAWPDEMTNLMLVFQKFYPDFALNEEGLYISKTPLANNPMLLYAVYYNGHVIQMNLAKPGEIIEVSDYRFVLRDPIEYTLLVIKRDPAILLVGISSIIIVLGLFLSFYMKPRTDEAMENK